MTEGFEEMVRACIAAHDAVMVHGTSEMQLAAQILLKMIGDQLAKETRYPVGVGDNENYG
ncbi:hypothetical protein [Methylobacterium longum]|uniref:Uncharacterized protein n=1 Tax=Methylobacterium longum TaxID=767694 RepID=A0ABT8AIK0_9HYPH|nr:hypothetical protein [Methylobacterium longum]MDN3569281.1 hypothetical protein [Methylobacterium longum]GJE14888.1 hypothetical protein FOHLNKBM_5965 [Methylobacterium longum]